MIDKILHAVTNRSDFSSSGLRSVSGFTPITPAPAAETVMRLLCLDYSTNDYYVQGALAAIDAFPAIREAFREGDRSYALSEFQRPPDTFTGVTPRSGAQGPWELHHPPKVFPVTFEAQLSFLDSNQMGVSWDGASFPVPCSVSDNTIFPDWPEDLGVVGALELLQAWGPGFRGTLSHVPTSFPYRAAVELLDLNTDKNELLLHAGLIEHYSFAADALEKFATVLLAVGVSNLQRWP